MKIAMLQFRQIIKEEFSRILKEDEVQVDPGGTWGPPLDLSAPQDIGSLSDDLITKIMAMSEESPEEAQEALETLTATLDSAGVLDAMCSTTQGVMGFRMRESQLKQLIKEEFDAALDEQGGPHADKSFDELSDFWMNELNSALMASMSDAGLANKMLPSDFLEAILPVLQAYGSGFEAEEMVAHVRSNQDIYSPRRPAGGGFPSTGPGPALHGKDVPGFGEDHE